MEINNMDNIEIFYYSDGTVSNKFIRDKILHNENGPAEITPEYSAYYYNGKLHNENGPAIIFKTRKRNMYFIYGQYVGVNLNKDIFNILKKEAILLTIFQ